MNVGKPTSRNSNLLLIFELPGLLISFIGLRYRMFLNSACSSHPYSTHILSDDPLIVHLGGVSSKSE